MADFNLVFFSMIAVVFMAIFFINSLRNIFVQVNELLNFFFSCLYGFFKAVDTTIKTINAAYISVTNFSQKLAFFCQCLVFFIILIQIITIFLYELAKEVIRLAEEQNKNNTMVSSVLESSTNQIPAEIKIVNIENNIDLTTLPEKTIFNLKEQMTFNNQCIPKEYEDFLFKKVSYDTDTVCLSNDYSINLVYWEEIMPLLKQQSTVIVPCPIANIAEPQIITQIVYEPLVCNCSTNTSSVVSNSTLNNSSCFINTTSESLQMLNSSTDSLKTIASIYNDNMHLILLTGVVVFIGYSVWRYLSYKNTLNIQSNEALPPIPTNRTNEVHEITNPSLNNIAPISLPIDPEKEVPSANLLDFTAESLTNLTIENHVLDDVFLDLLIEQNLAQLEQKQILEEIFNLIRDQITINAPAIDATANIISNFSQSI